MKKSLILLLFGILNYSIFYGQYSYPKTGYHENSVSYHDVDKENLSKKNYTQASPSENLDSLLSVSFKGFYLTTHSFNRQESIKISLDINKDGSIRNVVIINSPFLTNHESEKIRRVFSNMKKWIPAKKKSSQTSSISIKFNLKVYRTILDEYFNDGCKNLTVNLTSKYFYTSVIPVGLPLVLNNTGSLSLASEFPIPSNNMSFSDNTKNAIDSLIKHAPQTNSLPNIKQTITIVANFGTIKNSQYTPIPDRPQDNYIYFASDLSFAPEYHGDLIEHLIENLKALKLPIRNKLSGKPFNLKVFFVVEKDGSVSNVIIPSKYKTLLSMQTNELITHAIEKTKWFPGIRIDTPVRARLVQPITISP